MRNNTSSKNDVQESTLQHIPAAKKEHQMTTPTSALSRNSLVRPTIYSYTCHGSLHFDDALPNNSNNNNNHRDLHLPPCTGIETHLKRVMDLPPMTKEVAVQHFINETDPYGIDDDEVDKERGGRLRDGEYGTTEKRERLVEKYGYDPTRTRPIVAYPPFSPHHHHQCSPSGDNNRLENNQNAQLLKNQNGNRSNGGCVEGEEEEKPKMPHDDEQWSTLSCYGNTQVSILMLHENKPTMTSGGNKIEDGDLLTKDNSNNNKLIDNNDELAGISPDCTFGVTMRDVGTDDGGDSLVTLRLGPVEISVGNHYDFEEDDVDHDENSDNFENPAFAQAGVFPPKDHSISSTSSSAPTQRQRRHTVIHNNQNDNNTTSSSNNNSDDDNNIEPFEKRFMTQMYQTASCMKSNAELLYNSASKKDFPHKVVLGGEKVVGHFGKTLGNTSKFASDLAKMWGFKSSDGDGNDDDHYN